jgi:triacylglycerol lipase
VNLVFATGFLIPQRIASLHYFRGLKEIYPDALFPEVPGASSVELRAKALAAAIAARFPSGQIHIVAHSMAGLDSRYLLCHNLNGLAAEGRVATLSTIATPHRGTPAADLLVGGEPSPLDPRWVTYMTLSHLTAEFVDIGAVGDLTTKFATEFNASNKDLPHLRYFAYAGVTIQSFLLAPVHKWIEFVGKTAEEKTNDGLVNLASAKWPETLAEEPWQADHISQVGWDLDRPPDFHAQFDHFAAYDRVVRRATGR